MKKTEFSDMTSIDFFVGAAGYLLKHPEPDSAPILEQMLEGLEMSFRVRRQRATTPADRIDALEEAIGTCEELVSVMVAERAEKYLPYWLRQLQSFNGQLQSQS
jgi:hypothetical protein